MFGLFLLFWGLLVLLSLLTHNQNDPSLNHVVSGAASAKNGAGLFGAYLSGLLVDVFGFAAFVWPLFFLAWGAGCISSLITLPWWRWLGFLLLALCLLSLGTAWSLGLADVRGGGMLGRIIYARGTRLFSPAGFTLIWLFFLFISFELSFGIPWLELIRRTWSFVRTKAEESNLTWTNLRQAATKALPHPHLPLPRSRTERENREGGPLIIDLDLPMEALPAPASAIAPDARPKNAASSVVFRESPLPRATEDDHDEESFDFDDDQFPTPSRHKTSNERPYGDISGEDILDELEEDTPQPYPPTSQQTYHERIEAEPFSQTPPVASERHMDLSGLSARNLLQSDPDAVSPLAPRQNGTPALSSVTFSSTVSSSGAPSATALSSTAPPVASQPSPAPARPRKRAKPSLPNLDLLSRPAPVPGAPPSRDVLAAKGERLMACLADFGIHGELAAITPGPVISMFEIRPAPGVKVSRILGLSDDLAMALKATAVRIQAPVPGTDTVGVEIPNDVRAIVSFRELLQDPGFSASGLPLSMALGKDTGGHPFTTDLSRMPHLLVAGATGAGKSVCLNSILLSFLYKCTPEEVRLLLVDPKRIELAVYADLPHLVHPVVTEMPLAKTALEWAVHEMETRYDAMARMGVRNLSGFNKKLAEFGDAVPPGLDDLRPLPFLVIIIDELADLMMTAGKEIETHIVRLAQLARAAGIHLIVATQRPSVDVVTGLIKANFPCRISFQVTSKHDSRTILDTVGAEHLLGKGDMLFKPSGGKLQRLHGAFVSDEEVVSVVEYWKSQQAPNYAVDFADWGNDAGPVIMPGPDSENSDSEDSLYADVINFVREQGKVSISLIQRRFRIGFNKAARFVEQMEQDGIIQPGDRQNKARQVNRGE